MPNLYFKMSISAPPFQPQYTTTYGSMAVTPAAQGSNPFTILPPNLNRVGGGLIVNNTNKTLFISIGETPPTLNNGFGVPPGGNFDILPGQRDAVRGIASNPSGTIIYFENTI
jgi:hypothetical protein